MPDMLSHPNLNELNQAPRKPVYHDIHIADRKSYYKCEGNFSPCLNAIARAFLLRNCVAPAFGFEIYRQDGVKWPKRIHVANPIDWDTMLGLVW